MRITFKKVQFTHDISYFYDANYKKVTIKTNLSDFTCNIPSQTSLVYTFLPSVPEKQHFIPNTAFRRSWQKQRGWKNTTATLICCCADVFTLTCCWGSGTSPPFWSWGHPLSWLHSHKEPQTESPLQVNKKWHVVVRVRRREFYRYEGLWWDFHCGFIVGFVHLSNTWAEWLPS